MKAGGKPSTWFPPGGLVEQDISTLTKSTYQINVSKKTHLLDSPKMECINTFHKVPFPQWPWFVANPEFNANDLDYSVDYSLCFATSQHAHNQHLQTSAMHMQNRIHKNKCQAQILFSIMLHHWTWQKNQGQIEHCQHSIKKTYPESFNKLSKFKTKYDRKTIKK